MTLEEFLERIDDIMCGTSNAERAYLEDLYDEVTKPHWISVEEELPPKRSKYDYFSVNVLATDGKEIYESVYNHDSEDWFTHDLWGLDNITHWMHLPSVEHLKDK